MCACVCMHLFIDTTHFCVSYVDMCPLIYTFIYTLNKYLPEHINNRGEEVQHM